MHDEPDFIINNDDQPIPPVAPTPDHHQHAAIVETSRKEYMKLAGIIVFLFLSASLMSALTNFNVEEWLRWFMGGFFIIFGSFKLIGYEMFVLAFPSYDIIAKKHKLYAYVYPFIELFLGVLYVLNLMIIPRDIFTLIIMSVSAVGVAKSVMHRDHIQCACLGNIIRLPLTTVSLIENITMVVMALVMLLTSLFT